MDFPQKKVVDHEISEGFCPTEWTKALLKFQGFCFFLRKMRTSTGPHHQKTNKKTNIRIWGGVRRNLGRMRCPVSLYICFGNPLPQAEMLGETPRRRTNQAPQMAYPFFRSGAYPFFRLGAYQDFAKNAYQDFVKNAYHPGRAGRFAREFSYKTPRGPGPVLRQTLPTNGQSTLRANAK